MRPSGRKLEPPPKLFIGGAEVPTQGKPNPDKILNKLNVQDPLLNIAKKLINAVKIDHSE